MALGYSVYSCHLFVFVTVQTGAGRCRAACAVRMNLMSGVVLYPKCDTGVTRVIGVVLTQTSQSRL